MFFTPFCVQCLSALPPVSTSYVHALLPQQQTLPSPRIPFSRRQSQSRMLRHSISTTSSIGLTDPLMQLDDCAPLRISSPPPLDYLTRNSVPLTPWMEFVNSMGHKVLRLAEHRFPKSGGAASALGKEDVSLTRCRILPVARLVGISAVAAVSLDGYGLCLPPH